MPLVRTQPTGVARTFGENEVIVSKTDTTGKITYVNPVFSRISGFSEEEALGQPHSLIRHPDMPRCVFKLLWDRLFERQEVFAYVVNLAKNGDHYWVFAHVTPTFDAQGEIIGFHSNRRSPDPGPIERLTPIYAELCRIEAGHALKADGLAASSAVLMGLLNTHGISYDEFVFTL